MIHKTRGIVLSHTRYSETSAIVRVFTREFGMQCYMVNGVFGKKKQDKVLLLQPLNILNMDVYFNQGRDIQRIKEFKLERPLMVIPFSQARRAQVFLITELLSRVLRTENTNVPLFSFLDDAINVLDSEHEGLENFHLFFLFHLLKFLGFFPHNNYSRFFPVFDLQEGCFVSSEPAHPYFLNTDNSLIFYRLFLFGQNELSRIACNRSERRTILDALLLLIGLHFDGAGNLRSVEVLGDLFIE